MKPNQEVIFPYLCGQGSVSVTSVSVRSATERGLFQDAFGFRFTLLMVFFHKENRISKTEAKYLPVEFEA